MRLVLLASIAVLLDPSNSAFADDVAANLVVAVQGKVMIQRQNWTGTSPAVIGTVLRLGDLIEPDAGGKASILCADLKLATSDAAQAGVPCPPGSQTKLKWDGARVAPARSASTDFPRLLYPRATDILDGRPQIAWTPATSVSSYQVSIEGPNFTWTSPPVNATVYAYPTSAPALKAETEYQVVVRGGGSSSRDEGVPGSGFRLLGAARQSALRELKRHLEAIPLTNQARRLALAHLYADQRLLLMAIAALGNPNDAAGLNFLGDLQLRVQRPDLAIDAFKQAASLASVDDVENGAYARKMLARLLLGTDDAQAKKLLDEASREYRTLGDREALAEIARLSK
jgi:hypothetical protein